MSERKQYMLMEVVGDGPKFMGKYDTFLCPYSDWPAMAEHIAGCNEHPMRAMFDELQEAQRALRIIRTWTTHDGGFLMDHQTIADLCDRVLKASVKPRLDREGRDVTDLPGLWDEGDTFEKASVTT